MTDKTKIELHYWRIRGLAESVKTLLEYTKLNYETIYKTDYNAMMLEKQELINQGFIFANLPYIKDGNFYLSETMSILMHIARKAKRPDLIGEGEESVKFQELLGVVLDYKSILTSLCYSSKDLSELKTKILMTRERIRSKIQGIGKILKNNQFLFKRLTVLDFYFAEFVDMIATIQNELQVDILEDFNEVYLEYRARFYSISEIKAYRESNKFFERPFNSPLACWR